MEDASYKASGALTSGDQIFPGSGLGGWSGCTLVLVLALGVALGTVAPDLDRGVVLSVHHPAKFPGRPGSNR